MRTAVPGWTVALARWQRARVESLDDLRDISESIFAALDFTCRRHVEVARSVLALKPYYPLAEKMLAAARGLWALDIDEAEIALLLWRAEIEARA